jgi:hypothetical protein
VVIAPFLAFVPDNGFKTVCQMKWVNDDDPFIVLTETKFSFRCIPVWIGTLLAGLGSKKRTHVIMFSP